MIIPSLCCFGYLNKHLLMNFDDFLCAECSKVYVLLAVLGVTCYVILSLL